MTARICQLYADELGIPTNNIYVTYHGVNDWGWNGRNFYGWNNYKERIKGLKLMYFGTKKKEKIFCSWFLFLY